MELGMVKQSFPFLIICGMGGILAGSLLGNMADLFRDHPGLIVIIPAVIGMRGNVFTTLGSRLGSSIHLGIIDPEDVMSSTETHENIYATMFLGLAMSVVIAIAAYATSVAAGVRTIGLIPLILVAVISAILAGVVLVTVTIWIMKFSFTRGLDPDNVTGPIITTVGDIVSVLAIYLVVVTLVHLGVMG